MTKYNVWIIAPITVLFLGIGFAKIAKFSRKKKNFAEKYDIGYYFK